MFIMHVCLLVHGVHLFHIFICINFCLICHPLKEELHSRMAVLSLFANKKFIQREGLTKISASKELSNPMKSLSKVVRKLRTNGCHLGVTLLAAWQCMPDIKELNLKFCEKKEKCHFGVNFSLKFVLQQAGFMTSVQGLLGKLGPKKGGGKKVSTARRMH